MSRHVSRQLKVGPHGRRDLSVDVGKYIAWNLNKRNLGGWKVIVEKLFTFTLGRLDNKSKDSEGCV